MAEKESKTKKGLTRRTFLKATGAVGAGVAALKLLDIAPDPAMADTEWGGGYVGKILHVDLGGGHLGNDGGGILTQTEPTYKYADRFLGARGIHEWMIFNNVPIDADPLGEESLICLGAGPLIGTLYPSAARLEITSVNVLTGGTDHSNGGSDVCCEMKYAGYDNIIISGKAGSQSYLYIEDDRVELRDASHLWGKNLLEATNVMREELGDKWIRAVGIGVAGENLSKIASVQGAPGWRAHAGNGHGAIWGSKNLKLVAVRGHGAVKVADPEKFKETVDALWAKAPLSPRSRLEGWAGGATVRKPTEILTRLRNCQQLGSMYDYSIEERDSINQIAFDAHGYTGKRFACRHCGARQMDWTYYKITDGPHAGVKTAGYMSCYQVSWFGLLDPVLNPADLQYWIWLGDSLGVDDGKLGATISWAHECYQRGLLTTEDTGGIELVWPRDKGDNETLFQVAEDIAHRRGKLGELLADGAFEAAKKIAGRLSDEGKPPEYYVVGTKKGVVNKDHARGGHRWYAKGGAKWLFACAVSSRGGMHNDGSAGTGPAASTMTPEEYANMKNLGVYPETGRWVSHGEWEKEVYDALGMCWNVKDFSHDEIATALNYATGSSFTGNSLLYQMGRKLYNIAKAINTLRTGWTREYDQPMERVTEPLPPPNDPFCIDVDKWNEQLDKYYDFHGWDRETGWQKRKTLNDLDLGQVALALWREDKLK